MMIVVTYLLDHPINSSSSHQTGIKAFYMRDSDDGETCDSFDLLVPGVGELIGGSQREERLDQLTKKMGEFNLNPDDYWYVPFNDTS